MPDMIKHKNRFYSISDMNTRMGLAEGENIPVNLAVLNQFMFWRADVEFEFVSVQTQYHSLRLQSMNGLSCCRCKLWK